MNYLFSQNKNKYYDDKQYYSPQKLYDYKNQ